MKPRSISSLNGPSSQRNDCLLRLLIHYCHGIPAVYQERSLSNALISNTVDKTTNNNGTISGIMGEEENNRSTEAENIFIRDVLPAFSKFSAPVIGESDLADHYGISPEAGRGLLSSLERLKLAETRTIDGVTVWWRTRAGKVVAALSKDSEAQLVLHPLDEHPIPIDVVVAEDYFVTEHSILLSAEDPEDENESKPIEYVPTRNAAQWATEYDRNGYMGAKIRLKGE